MDRFFGRPAVRVAPYVGGGLLLALFGVQAFLRGVRVPLLGWIDLAIHEFGHLAFLWAPEDLMLLMGNGTQALVPLLLAGVFLFRERDLLGGGVCIGWAATSLQDASVYIADAPWRMLPLLGPESSHDWWQLLGKHGLLKQADAIAHAVWLTGLALFVVAAVAVLVGPWLEQDVREHGVVGALRRLAPPPEPAPEPQLIPREKIRVSDWSG